MPKITLVPIVALEVPNMTPGAIYGTFLMEQTGEKSWQEWLKCARINDNVYFGMFVAL